MRLIDQKITYISGEIIDALESLMRDNWYIHQMIPAPTPGSYYVILNKYH